MIEKIKITVIYIPFYGNASSIRQLKRVAERNNIDLATHVEIWGHIKDLDGWHEFYFEETIETLISTLN
jgi:hypothetical protein